MRYGVLGTGVVGATLGSRLVQLGHEVTMGGRAAGGDRATAWVHSTGERAAEGTFANAARFGDVVINATAGVRVVKSLNTMNCDVMVDPSLVDGHHNVFVCGDDEDAKVAVTEMLHSFGWPAAAVVDLGASTTRAAPRCTWHCGCG